MITFKNIKISKQVFEERLTLPIIYFEDENGNDWYETRDEQWQGVNHFIAVDKNNFINTWAENPNFLTLSEGVSIYEVLPKKIPNDINSHTYIYIHGELLKYSRPANETAELQKKNQMNLAISNIDFLQDAVDIDDATEDEINRLKSWKIYRVALNRLDLSKAPDINWPKLPT